MSETAHYQLTKHPIGTVREVWTLSWPLMLSFMSGNLMTFIDRLYLARLSLDAMNALAIAGLACFLPLILPIVICEMTEVFVGRLHGGGNLSKVSQPVWQMLWFSFLAWPCVVLLGLFCSSLLFSKDSLESRFMSTWLAVGTPGMLASITLMGFFIAIGKTKLVTYCMLLANVLNACLAPLLIFGSSVTPALGIEGSAIATGCAQWFQALFLLVLFLSRSYRTRYHTTTQGYSKELFLDMCRVALPASLGRIVEILAHSLYFQIMTLAGKEALTCATLTQSFFFLMMFCIDGTAKSAMAVMSNLVGAERLSFVPRVMKSAFLLHSTIFCCVALLCFLGIDAVLPFMLAQEDLGLLENSAFVQSLKLACVGLCLFFLFDGYAWISAGFLTAVKDTKFIFYTALTTSCLTYLLPLYLMVQYAGAGGATGWSVIAFNSLCLFVIFFTRSQLFIRSTESREALEAPSL